MTPSIVVLTDFFAVSNRALSYAAGLAVPLQANLLLLHTRNNALLALAAFASPNTAAGKQHTLNALEKLAAEQPVATTVDISDFSLVASLQEMVGPRPPLLVVLGRAGTGPNPEDPVTDIAGNLLRQTSYPLLLVPTASPDAFLPRRLLLAVDGEPFRLVEYRDVLSKLLHATHGTLSLVQVTANGETPPSAAAVLDTVLANDLVTGLTEGSLHQVHQNTVADGILQEAAVQQTDLLIVIARRHSLLGGLFHRSVTARLLRESSIPVLVLSAEE